MRVTKQATQLQMKLIITTTAIMKLKHCSQMVQDYLLHTLIFTASMHRYVNFKFPESKLFFMQVQESGVSGCSE